VREEMRMFTVRGVCENDFGTARRFAQYIEGSSRVDGVVSLEISVDAATVLARILQAAGDAEYEREPM